MSDEIKTGAYICKGCGLGERLDCDQLATIAEREGKANIVKQHDFLCSAEGVAMIQGDIDNEGVNRLVENIRVEYYGSPTPLKQLATITIPEPRTIVIKPFDASQITEVAKAIQASDLGINPAIDGRPQQNRPTREVTSAAIALPLVPGGLMGRYGS